MCLRCDKIAKRLLQSPPMYTRDNSKTVIEFSWQFMPEKFYHNLVVYSIFCYLDRAGFTTSSYKGNPCRHFESRSKKRSLAALLVCQWGPIDNWQHAPECSSYVEYTNSLELLTYKRVCVCVCVCVCVAKRLLCNYIRRWWRWMLVILLGTEEKL